MEISPHNEEVITTARRGVTSRTHDNSNPESVMREWVDEFTGRVDRANAGLRVPTDMEIAQLTIMFPALEREVVVGALQRRSVPATRIQILGLIDCLVQTLRQL